jgi:ribose/xylose/arabinose/galactoside ABC-type transport system permease subunit
MKKITQLSIVSITALVIGGILMMGGNKGGEYITIAGTIIGMYTAYLMDREHQKNPDNRI